MTDSSYKIDRLAPSQTDRIVLLHGHGRNHFKITACKTFIPGSGDCLLIPLQEGMLHITKEQVMEAFDLVEKKQETK